MAKHKLDNCSAVLNSLQDDDLFQEDAFQNLGDKDLELSNSKDEQRESTAANAAVTTTTTNLGLPLNPSTTAVATTATNPDPPSNPSTASTNATGGTGHKLIPVTVDAANNSTAGLTARGSTRGTNLDHAVKR